MLCYLAASLPGEGGSKEGCSTGSNVQGGHNQLQDLIVVPGASQVSVVCFLKNDAHCSGAAKHCICATMPIQG